MTVFDDPTCLPGVSLHQPYAGLIRLRLKTLETRPRRIHYRGDLVICAGLTRNVEALAELHRRLVPARVSAEAFDEACALAGVMVAVVRVVDCRPLLAEDEPAALYHRAGEKRWAWVLEDIRPLVPRVVSGVQGFIRVPRSKVQETRSAA